MEFPTWVFPVIAVILALVIGRLGTIVREQISTQSH